MALGSGWWIEAWSMVGGSHAKVIDSIPVLNGTFEDTLDGIGHGSILVPATYDRLTDIIDPTNDVETVLKLYLDGTLLGTFFAREVTDPYGDSDRVVTISGPGIGDVMDWAIAFPFDYPVLPSVWPDWIFGSDQNAVSNGGGEENPEHIQNNFAEDGATEPWFSTAATLTVTVVSPYSGTYSFECTADVLEGGFSQVIPVWPRETYSVQARIKSPAGTTIQVGLTGSDDISSSDFTRVNIEDPEAGWPTETEVQKDNAGDGTYKATSVNILTGSSQTSMKISFRQSAGTLSAFQVDEILLSGVGSGTDPWQIDGGAVTSFEAINTDSNSGTHSIAFQGQIGARMFQEIGGVTPGGWYHMKAAVKAFDTPVPDFFMEVTDIHGNILSSTLIVPADGTNWYDYSLPPFQLPTFLPGDQDSPTVQVGFRIADFDPAPAAALLRIDDVEFLPGFLATTVGDILQQLMDDATTDHSPGRVALDFLKYDSFTTTLDSNAVAWADSEVSVNIKRGMTYRQVLEGPIHALGYEWEVVWNSGASQYELKVYNPDGLGTDNSATVGVLSGQPISGGTLRSSAPGKNALLVEGRDGLYKVDTNATDLAAYGRRERYEGDTEWLDQATVDAVAASRLTDELKLDRGVKLTIDGSATVRPYNDFVVGDIIRVDLSPSLPDSNLRVNRIGTNLLPEGALNYEVDFNSEVIDPRAAPAVAASRLLRQFAPLVDVAPSPSARRRPLETFLTQKGGVPTVFVAAVDASPKMKNIADFVCDGVDDEDTINEAIDSLELLSPGDYGGRVLLSEGNFECEGPIYMTVNNNYDTGWMFAGLGIGVTTVRFNSGSASNCISLQEQEVTMRDMTVFYDSGVASYSNAVIAFQGPLQQHCIDVEVNSSGGDSTSPPSYGIFLDGGFNRGIIRGCFINDFSSDGYNGGGLRAEGFGSQIIGNQVGTIQGVGMSIDTDTAQIIGNMIAADIGIILWDGSPSVQGGLTISGNQFQNCGTGIETGSSQIQTHVPIVGNQFHCKRESIKVANLTRSLITGNIFNAWVLTPDATYAAIELGAGCDDNWIHGNSFHHDTNQWTEIVDILSGATNNIIGRNDGRGAYSNIDYQDAGTGTIFEDTDQEVMAQTGVLSVGNGVSRLMFSEPLEIIDVRAMVDTAPTGASLIVDVHKNGTTIFTTQGNRPTIAASGFDSGLAVPDVTALAAGDYLTVDIDQVGSTIAGSDLTVAVRYRPKL